MPDDIEQKVKEQRMFGEELQRKFDLLEKRVEELKKTEDIAKPFKDVEHDAQRIIDVLHAGLPVLTAVPTYTGFEGEFIWVVVSSVYYLYAYISGGWRKIGELVSDTTPQLGGDLDLNHKSLDTYAIPSTDGTGEGVIVDDIDAGESIAFPNLVYLKSDGNWWKVDADAVATCQGLLGIALETKTAGNACKVLLHGFIRNNAWNLTPGTIFYAGTEVGTLSDTAPSGTDDVVKIVGVATHADCIYIHPEMTTVIHS